MAKLLINVPGLCTETKCEENANGFFVLHLGDCRHRNRKRGDAEDSSNLRLFFITLASPLISAITVGTASDNCPIKSRAMAAII
jgi:hypothetical protein